MAMKIRHENEYGGLDSVCTCNLGNDARIIYLSIPMDGRGNKYKAI